MAKTGRKSKFKERLFEKICLDIEDGNSQRQACKNHNIAPRTFRDWLKNEDLKEIVSPRYARAREQQIRGIQDNLRERPLQFLEYYFDELGNKRLDSASVQLARLMVDTDKFLLARLMPSEIAEIENTLKRYTVELVEKSDRNDV